VFESALLGSVVFMPCRGFLDIIGLSGCGTGVCFNVAAEIFLLLPLFALHFLIVAQASPTVTIFPASSSGISIPKHSSRKFVLFSNTGDRKEVDCDMDQFMRVLSLIRELVPTEEVIYV
jgi:hypothetical protein